jgi:hypothetical protein
MTGDRELPSEDELRRQHLGSNAVLIRVSIERVGPKGVTFDAS